MDQEVYQDELTLEDIIRIFKKRFWVFFVTFILTVALVVIYLLFFATPIYEASATLKIKESTPSSGLLSSLVGFNIGGEETGTAIEIIKSRRNLENVVDELDLVSYFKKQNPEITKNEVFEMLVEKILSVENIKDSELLKISVRLPDPVLARDIANKLVEVSNKLIGSLSKNEYSAKRQFIEEQIPKVEKELKEAEENLRKFKEENKIFVLDEEAKNYLSLMVELESQINSYKLQQQENKATIDALNEMLKKVDEKIISSETITTNPIVEQLKSKLVEYRIELAGLSHTYSESDPKILEIKEKINETEKLLKEEVSKIVSSQVQTINPAYQELYSQLIESQYKAEVYDSIIKSLETLKGTYLEQLSKLPLLEQKLLELTRDLKVKESIYTLLLEKLQEAVIAEAGTVGTIDIIDYAIVPEKPAKPNKKLTLAIGGVLGIFLGILFVFVAEYADKSIKDEEDLKRFVKGIPILGRIPRFYLKKESEKPELIILNDPKSIQAESLKLLAANINYSISPEPKVIEITSPAPNEGRTTIAANLAISYAQSGIKTLLLNLDMRKPRLEEVLGIEQFNVGIADYITKDEPIEKIVQNYMENLDVISVGTIPPNPSLILTSKKLKELIDKLREEYEKIIFDLPPLLVAADALIVSKHSDGLLVVIRAEETLKHSLKIALENIETAGANLLGFVINDINEKSSSYYISYYNYYNDSKKRKS